MKQLNGFTRRIQNKLFRQQSLGGKMEKLILRIAVEAIGAAETMIV